MQQVKLFFPFQPLSTSSGTNCFENCWDSQTTLLAAFWFFIPALVPLALRLLHRQRLSKPSPHPTPANKLPRSSPESFHFQASWPSLYVAWSVVRMLTTPHSCRQPGWSFSSPSWSSLAPESVKNYIQGTIDIAQEPGARPCKPSGLNMHVASCSCKSNSTWQKILLTAMDWMSPWTWTAFYFDDLIKSGCSCSFVGHPIGSGFESIWPYEASSSWYLIVWCVLHSIGYLADSCSQAQDQDPSVLFTGLFELALYQREQLCWTESSKRSRNDTWNCVMAICLGPDLACLQPRQ